jgi:hypothetical protein
MNLFTKFMLSLTFKDRQRELFLATGRDDWDVHFSINGDWFESMHLMNAGIVHRSLSLRYHSSVGRSKHKALLHLFFFALLYCSTLNVLFHLFLITH